ncbi:hypothetical protein M6B38_139275 [Iris pallida]|uniref:Uncharacterized protein n=1 Tax=Iris pallida TaxID=29817 RepID=A0AAX6FCD6_IRIPA|nr:hypothetical protein M6B38_139275 [Iris pallida]
MTGVRRSAATHGGQRRRSTEKGGGAARNSVDRSLEKVMCQCNNISGIPM